MMRKRALPLLPCLALSAALVVIPGARPGDAAARAATTVPFAVASVRFERNATDGDVEIVFEAKGGDAGLAYLEVTSPDGRTVVEFNAPDASTLGIRQFHLESPEPTDVAALKAAYPEGKYQFRGRTVSGKTLAATSTLSHRLPATVQFATPAPEATNVAVANAKITWRAVPGVARYIVEIEQDELGTNIVAVLPRGTTSFAVPEGFLMPGTEYEVAIGTVDEAGNRSFVETSFTTAK